MPDEFEDILTEQSSDVMEFVMHPALPKPGDASIDMLFTADMRVRDVDSTIAIINFCCIEQFNRRVRLSP